MAAALCCIIEVNLRQTETSSHSSDTTLANNLIERGRAKSKVERLQFEQVENGAKNEPEVGVALQKLSDLNNTIQATKEALGITGTLRTLKF